MTDAQPSGQLFLVRHTPVKVPAGTCYGRTDLPLDDAKFDQMVPEIHAQLPIHAVLLCSPLSRCLHLANALLARASGRSVVVEPSLVERDFGTWEGRRWDDIPRAEIDAWAADFTNYAPPDGESVIAMAERSRVALLNRRQAGIPMIVVSHAGPLAAISARLDGTVLSANTRSQTQGTVVELSPLWLRLLPR